MSALKNKSTASKPTQSKLILKRARFPDQKIGDKPRLYELQTFQFVKNGREESINIIEATASRWRELGTALEFGSHRLRNIEMNRSSVEDRCYELLRQWLATGNKSITWEALLLAMMKAGCNDVAEPVWEFFTDEDPPLFPSMIPPQHEMHKAGRVTSMKIFIIFAVISFIVGVLFAHQYYNHPIVEYRKYLRKYYSTPYPPYSKPVLNRPEQPIDLVLVRQQKKQRKEKLDDFRGKMLASSVNISTIGSLNDGKMAAHFVLIEGSPGIGKSMLCWQLCRLWRDGKMLHKWDLMVIAELRDESTRNAENIEDILHYSDIETRQAIAKHIIKHEGKGLFLLLDGYDELSKQQLNGSLMIRKILTNKLISEATIVVTSRPDAIAELPDAFKNGLISEYQHIKVSGFDKTDIEKYVKLASGDDQHLLDDISRYIYTNRFVLSVMHNPLHCTIVTELYIQYWSEGQQLFVPNTLTDIYTALVMNHLRHDKPNLNIEQLSEVPGHVNDSLMVLAKLAAKGLEENKYVFSSSDVPKKLEKLGLLVSVRKLYEIGVQPTSYIFLHLTLQEYFSALYWSRHLHQLPKELQSLEAIKHVTQRLQKTRNVIAFDLRWPMYLFLAGITKLEAFPLLLESSYDESYDISLVCQLLFEAQSSQVVSNFFANSSVSNSFIKDRSPLDWFVCGYCIANSDNHSFTWYLEFFYNEALQSFSDGIHYSVKDTGDWDERYKPSITVNFLHTFFHMNSSEYNASSLNPFAKSITALGLELSPESSLHTDFFSYFPRLTALELPSWSLSNNSFQLPHSLTHLKLCLPKHDELFDNIHQYQSLTELYICKSHSIMVDHVCKSFERNLPKLTGKLKILKVNYVYITHQCINGIVPLLKSSLHQFGIIDFGLISFSNFDELITAMADSNLKHFTLYGDSGSFSNVILKPLTKLLTMTSTTLEEVAIIASLESIKLTPLTNFEIEPSTTDCDSARVLVEAMAHRSKKQKIPILNICFSETCSIDTSHLNDTVICKH